MWVITYQASTIKAFYFQNKIEIDSQLHRFICMIFLFWQPTAFNEIFTVIKNGNKNIVLFDCFLPVLNLTLNSLFALN